jgi:hypothetical protein
MGEMKFCKDCKWLERGPHISANCLHDAAKYSTTNLVTGETKEQRWMAEFFRNAIANGCGQEARYFETLVPAETSDG